MQTQLTKVQYIQSIEILGGNIVVTIKNAAQIIINPVAELLFDSGILYCDSAYIIQALTDPNNISYEA